jgi:DNA repair protein RecO (recombination protein O)
MSEWEDDAFVLSARAYGETGALVMLLTKEQGRHTGIVAGGQGRAKQAILQPGQQVRASWYARLSEQLGTLKLEPAAPYPSAVLDDSFALAGLASACAITEQVLPEREAHLAVYEGLAALIQSLNSPHWPYVYIKWELGLLAEIGYGINTTRCAVTGASDSVDDPLCYVSPRTGRAVCRSAAAPYKERLLPLPAFLLGHAPEEADIEEGLRLTGCFLERAVFALHHKPLAAPRTRLYEKALMINTSALA